MDSKTDKPYTETSPHRARSFKAVIVVTRHDGIEPTLPDIQNALAKVQLAYAMPADVSGPVVISFGVPKGEAI